MMTSTKNKNSIWYKALAVFVSAAMVFTMTSFPLVARAFADSMQQPAEMQQMPNENQPGEDQLTVNQTTGVVTDNAEENAGDSAFGAMSPMADDAIENNVNTASLEAQGVSNAYDLSVGDTLTIEGTSGWWSNSWKSSNAKVASVDETDGSKAFIMGLSEGTATITHEGNYGKKETFTVNVTWGETVNVYVYLKIDDLSDLAKEALGIKNLVTNTHGYAPVGVLQVKSDFFKKAPSNWSVDQLAMLNNETDYTNFFNSVVSFSPNGMVDVGSTKYSKNNDNNVTLDIIKLCEHDYKQVSGTSKTALFTQDEATMTTEYGFDKLIKKVHLDAVFQGVKVTYKHESAQGDVVVDKNGKKLENLAYIKGQVISEPDIYVDPGYEYEYYHADGKTLWDFEKDTVSQDSVIVLKTIPKKIGYTVNYYKDSIDSANLIKSDTGRGKVGTVIPYENGKYLPVGYKAPGTVTGQTTVTNDAAKNVLNIVYAKDSFGYTVNYYKESAVGTYESTPFDTVSGTAEFESVISDYPEKSIKGYTFDYDQGNPLTISSDSAHNVINVYYAIDKTGTDDPSKGDGVPDRYQVTFKYEAAAHGAIASGAKTIEVMTITDAEGKYAQTGTVIYTGSTAMADAGYKFKSWTGDMSGSSAVLASGEMAVTGGSTYTATADFEIDFGDVKVTGIDATYTGDEHYVLVENLIDGDTVIINGKTYTPEEGMVEIPYKDVINEQVTIEIKRGDDSITRTVDVKIDPASLTVVTEGASKVYDGIALTAGGKLTGLVNGETATFKTTGTQTDAGFSENTYSIVWNGSADAGNYVIAFETVGMLTVTEQSIVPYTPDYRGVKITDPTDVTYNGQEQKQPVVVTDKDGNVLIEGTDYTISYSEDVTNVGEVTVTIDGIGNYTGKVEKTYKIEPKSVTVTADDKTITYGDELGELTATVDGTVGTETVDYTVSYTGGMDAGTYTDKIVVSGNADQGNYKVTFAPGTLTIAPKSIEDQDDPGKPDVEHGITVEQPADTVYNGESQEQKPVVKDGDKVLEEGVDYDVIYPEDTTNAGTIDIVIIGKGNYEGKVDSSYQIKPATVTITTESASKTYDGTALTASGKIEGIVSGETVSFMMTGSQTEVGSSTNTYSLVWNGTAQQGNYSIVEVLGTLTVTAAPQPGPTPGPTPVPPAPTPTPDPTPGPTPETIAGNPTPMAQSIADDAVPMASSQPVCWVHWFVMLGMVMTFAYGLVAIMRRRGYTIKVDGFEDGLLNDRTGHDELRTGSTVKA